MKRALEKEIDKKLADWKRWHIDYMAGQVSSMQGEINCLKGYHNPVLSGDVTACSRCKKVLGKIVSPDAVCKSPKN